MVSQSSKKQPTTTTNCTDFTDLELVKRAEKKSVQDIQNAKKRADKIVAVTEQNLIKHKERAIASLTLILERKFKIGEKKAIQEAEKIKAESEAEAERLKQEVRGRIPNAVEHIVNFIISE